ncbi:hypothetical protein E1B28_008295 [Marasmius oreades]|uniref:F-box domain-containing protein n=1 Tax=Marasmius oreades TaxID=181124 RepID=A0A9P7UU50_9AGAR|nr:uncharacterized protein E1B28_008295 [Marasmius oreades]KAG7091894.1 hypothetical protein E1B28_008295 [Marasmius oreades]
MMLDSGVSHSAQANDNNHSPVMDCDSMNIVTPVSKTEHTSYSTGSLKELFRSIVTVQDRYSINSLLSDAQHELKSYEHEIHRLKATVMALESKRDWLKRSITRYRSLLAPIRTLPPEILTNIFALCCEENTLDIERASPVVILSMVCAQWREIVVSTPRLWSSLCIDFQHWDVVADRVALERMTRLFLKRSKKSPLKLVLQLPESKNRDFHTASTLDALVDTANRWRDVTLFSPWNVGPSRPILQGLRGQLPNLSSLHLNGTGPDDVKFDFFSSCPSLHSLRIQPGDDPYGPEYPTPRLILPWEQITSLKMYNSFAPSALSLLSQCSNVEYLELSLVGGGPNYSADIVSDALRCLTIEAREQDDVSCIFQSSTLRNLSVIDISGDIAEPTRDWISWDGGPLTDFIRRSSCTITSFRLKWVPIKDVQLISLLELMPALRSLRIEEYTTEQTSVPFNRVVNQRFLGHLALERDADSEYRSSKSLFLPRLTDLSLVMHNDNMDAGALVQAVSSRWLPDPEHASVIGAECIQSLAVVVIGEDGDSCTSLEILSTLECLRTTGGRVNISSRL